jgi:hypothetical protein
MAQMRNTIVAGQVSTESFVTLVYARIDPDTAAEEFVLAGHPPQQISDAVWKGIQSYTGLHRRQHDR